MSLSLSLVPLAVSVLFIGEALAESSVESISPKKTKRHSIISHKENIRTPNRVVQNDVTKTYIDARGNVSAVTVPQISKPAYEKIVRNVEESISQNKEFNLETNYTDLDILYKTLSEHRLNIKKTDSNTITAVCPESTMVFTRTAPGQPFHLRISSSEELNALKKELDDLSEEYGLNVQSYTYDHIINNLEEGMSIESEEVLEDNSIVLTINLGE